MKNYFCIVLSLIIFILLSFNSSNIDAQFQQKMCDAKAYRLYNDNNALYLCTLDKFYKYNAASGNFDPFFTLTNPYPDYLEIYSHLHFNKGKFYYYDDIYSFSCAPLDCDRHYIFNGATLDSLTYYSGPSPSPNFGMASAFIDSTLYFATLNYVYKSDYTSAGTTLIYTMPSMFPDPNLVYEQLDDLKAFHGKTYLIEIHVMNNNNHKCYLKKYDGFSWQVVDSSNGYITLHQGIDNLFYSLTGSTGPLSICKVAEIDTFGTVHTLYSGNANSRFLTGGAIGSIKNNIYVPATEKDTSGLGLFADRTVVCKVNQSGISSLNISTYQDAMPVLPFSYWISGNTAAVSNDTVLYFVANDTTSAAAPTGKGDQIWVTDGTNTNKILISGNTKDNNLQNAFYFNRSVAMCRDNLFVIFDADGQAGPLKNKLWQADRYGNAQSLFTMSPDGLYDYEDRYQNIASNKNSIFFTGDTNSLAQQNCIYKSDYCFLATSTPDLISASEFSVYPNPSNGGIYIKSSSYFNDASIRITNLMGETVLKQVHLSGNQFTIDLSKCADGIYFLDIYTDGKIQRMKIVKE